MRCPKCGTENAADMNFCKKCGNRLVASDKNTETQKGKSKKMVVDNINSGICADYFRCSVFCVLQI